MSKVKYRVREYNPTSAQQGSHSFFAEAVINNEITNNELAEKIAARTGVKAYEVTTVIAAIADIISEEVLESNRISLADHTGTKMVSIYPKVNGSVSDADIERETTAAHTADPSGGAGAVGHTEITEITEKVSNSMPFLFLNTNFTNYTNYGNKRNQSLQGVCEGVELSGIRDSRESAGGRR
jgi:hypothetical protein